MRITTLLLILICGLLYSCASGEPEEQADTRPNIILILANDMGYSGLGCMGSEIQTPNLDRLAGNGLLMAQFYNTSRCCLTRDYLLTGLYPHQAGTGSMVSGLPEAPAYQGYLKEQCITLGEVPGEAGYTTLLSGKWHVGEEEAHWPDERGFQKSFILLSTSMENEENILIS